jgi:tetratricopeptide (TPR) repeat protein
MRSLLRAPLLIAAAALFSLSCASAQASFKGLPFIEDDFDAAVAQAKQKNVPIFVDATASWCHSCISMRQYVFTDAKLAPIVDQFVWLELDMEKPENAVFRTKYPVEAFPTYFVIDGRNEKPLIRWVGGCSADRVLELLGEAKLAYKGETPERLAKADALYAEGKNDEAVTLYQEVFDTADPRAPYYARTVESLLFALSVKGDNERGVKLAEQTLPILRKESCAGNIAAYGLDFAVSLPEDNPDRAKLMADMERQAYEIVKDTSLDLAADDRSGLYISLLGAREAVHDDKGYKMIAQEWATFLDGAAAAAPTPAARAVFDSHRLSAYIELGEPEKAISFLRQSESDFPDNYNPPARLAIAYKEMKQWDDGIAAAERALSKPGMEGPRRLLIMQNLADLYAGKGDKQAERRTIEAAIAHGEALREGARSDSRVASLKKRLEAMGPA